MFKGLGVNYAGTLLGCVAVVLVPIPVVFYRYGARIRQRSKFAPAHDTKIALEASSSNGVDGVVGERRD